MGICEQLHDRLPDEHFMEDVSRLHDKVGWMKYEEWLGFAEVEVPEWEG